MTAVTIWTGPVSVAQTGDLRWPGTNATYVTCTGDGHPSCGELATQRSLDQVAGSADEVFLAAFSAGGQIVKRWLPNGKVRGVYLADGTYTHWAAPNEPAVDESLLAWVVKAAKDPRYRAVFTASSWPNKDLPNGAQTLEAIVRAAEKRGVRWNVHHPTAETVTVGDHEVGMPGRGRITLDEGLGFSDARMWSAGGAHMLDLGRTVKHEDHAKVIAPLLWPRLFVAAPAEVKGKQKGRGLRLALGLMGAVAVLGGVAYLLTGSLQRGEAAPRMG